MKPESIISIVALTCLALIFIVVPKIVDANERQQQYEFALLRRARRKWMFAINKALDAIEKKLGKK